MTILHHPPDPLLVAFSSGTLDLGQHIAIATHAFGCARCRNWARVLENIGGVTLDKLPPDTMANDALDSVMARVETPAATTDVSASGPLDSVGDIPGLPGFVRSYPAGKWEWVAPRLYMRSVHATGPGETRVFFLKAGPGVKLLPHAHTGIEMTCILSGSFSHDGGYYGAGDFDLGDPDVDHQISIGSEEYCICLVAMQGELRLKGIFGKLMQPFVSI
jgi:putative transcriptional regulator